ncbi:MAG: hypothetical protein WAK66_09620 [Methylocystis sp.]
MENSVAPTIRLAGADDKPVRSRAAGRVKTVSRVQPKLAVTQDSVEQPATKIVFKRAIRSTRRIARRRFGESLYTPLAWLKNNHSAPSAGHIREAGRQVRRLVACFPKREKTHEITGCALMDTSSPQTDND